MHQWQHEVHVLSEEPHVHGQLTHQENGVQHIIVQRRLIHTSVLADLFLGIVNHIGD